MALMVPSAFPHDLARKPRLEGEALVYAALQAALDAQWWVFYDRPIAGSRRRVDFIAANPDRGILAVEVKGGLVHDKRGSFRQLVSRAPVRRKRIDPFAQLRLGFRDLLAAAGVEAWAVPAHQAIWFPQMGQGGLRWKPSPHILTRELLEPAALRGLIAAQLGIRLSAVQGRAVGRVMGVLSRTRAASV